MVKPANPLLKFFATLQAELEVCSSAHPGKDAAIKRLLTRMRKRARIPVKGLTVKAVSEFVELNNEMASVSLSVPRDTLHCARVFISQVLERYTKRLDPDGVQETLCLEGLFDLWRFGPGASNGVTGTHAAEKIGQGMTSTRKAAPLVAKLREMNPYFRAIDGAYGAGVFLIEGSKLAVVPKNETTMRTIAIEPSGNMALQLAAGSYIEEALRGIGLDIQTQQPKNKRLAREASLDGGMATIDLKSASDRISLHLIRALWPREWVDLFMRLRSDSIQLPGKGGSVKLNMLSTMGNGFTFPCMTLTLLALLIANRCVNHGGTLNWVDWSRTAVFGDDIIVPTTEFPTLCKVLEQAGLVVNHDKSFGSGPFRESCGGDYYEGYDVTPFYVKSLSNDAEVFTAMNQLLDWAARNNKFLPRSLAVLADLLTVPRFVPEWMNPDQGIRTSLVAVQYTYIRPKPVRVRLRDTRFAVMLACGGYLVPGDKQDLMFYTPRPRKGVTYEVRKGRLPKGWCTGWDPLARSHHESQHVVEHLKMIG